jgi:hypothetical protein
MLLTKSTVDSGRTRYSNPFIALLAVLFTGFFYVPSFGQSLVFPTESVGATNVAATTLLATHETNNSFVNTALTMTAGGVALPADIRATSVSSTYTGFSAGNNVFFAATAGSYGFAIEGINASGYSSLSLQFGWRKESATALPALAIDYWNGTAYVNIPFTFTQTATAATGWYLSPAIPIPVAGQINGLRLRWTKSGSTSVRLDDISLTGILPVPTVNAIGNYSKFYGNSTIASESQIITVSGTNLTNNITVGPTIGFQFATAAAGPFLSSLTLNQVSGTVSATAVYARMLSSNAVGSYADTVRFVSVGAPSVKKPAIGQVYSAGLAFTPGNIVTLRVGESGGTVLSTNSAPVFIDEYTTNGVFVQSVPMPFSTNGSNRKFSISGTSTTEGFLNLSPDGQYLSFGGYDAIPGVVGISSSAAGSVNRVVARITQNGSINTTTAISDGHDAGSIRSACTVDGNAFWTGGAGTGGGNRYVTLGSAGTSVLVSGTPSNTRGSAIYNSQLYTSSQSGTNIGISTIGSGLPTTTGSTATILSGTASNVDLTNPQGFVFADIDDNGTADVLYAADGNLGIVKFSNTGGVWTKRGSLPNPSGRASAGLGLQLVGSNRVLFICLGTSASPANEIYKFTDNSAATANITSSGTNIIGACGSPIITSPASTTVLFKGVSFAPVNVPVPTVTHTFSTPSSTAEQGTPLAPLYQIKVDIADGSALLTGVTVQTAGTYTAASVTGFKLVVSTDAVLDAGDPILSTISSSTGSGQTLAFTGIGQNLPVNTSRYLFVCGAVSGCAGLGETIRINLVALANLTYSNVSTVKLGTPAAGSNVNVIQGTVDNVIGVTAPSGNPTVQLNWTNPSCFNQILIVAHTAPVTGIPAGTYTGNSTYSGAPLFVGGGRVVYAGSGNGITINGLTLNQLYYFKIFVKYGSAYSPGIEVTATPSLVNIYSRGSGSSHTDAIWSLSPTGTPSTLAAIGGMSTARGLVIQAGNVVSLSASGGTVVCRELIVNAGGTLKAVGTTTADNKFLYVYGDVTNNGTIGTGSTYNPICLGLEGTTMFFSGTGTTDLARIRKNTITNPTTTAFFKQTVNIRFTGGTGIYSNIDNSTLNLIVMSGARLSLVEADCDLALDGLDGLALGQRAGTLTVDGTINIGGTLFLRNNNSILGYGCGLITTAGSKSTINNLVYDGNLGLTTGFSISAGSKFDMLGALTVTSGSVNANGVLTLKSTSISTASIANSAGSITGILTAERYVPTVGWHLTGTVLANQTIVDWNDDMHTQGPMPGVRVYNPGSNTSSIFGYNDAYTVDDGLGEHNGWFVPTASDIIAGVGYRVWTPAGTTLDNTGTYNLNPSPINLSYATGSPYAGWNLVMNPHLSAINLAGISFGPSVQQTVVVWNQAISTYQYVGQLGGLTGVTLNNAIAPLASGTAFFVKCTAPSTLTIPQTAKTSSSGNFFRTATAPTALEIRIKNPNSDVDPTLFQFLDDAVNEYETRYDAVKMMNVALNVYTVINGERLAINALPFDSETKTIQLGYSTVLSGTHGFQFDGLSLLNGASQVWLKDNYSGTITAITNSDTQTFTTQAGTFDDRFELIFTNSVTSINKALPQFAGIKVYPNPISGTAFNIEIADRAGEVQVTVLDMLGRTINSDTFTNGQAIQVAKPNRAGQYVVKVKTRTSLHTEAVIVQ